MQTYTTGGQQSQAVRNMSPVWNRGLEDEVLSRRSLEGDHRSGADREGSVRLYKETLSREVVYHAGVATSVHHERAGDPMLDSADFSPIKRGDESAPHGEPPGEGAHWAPLGKWPPRPRT